ncbi:hypothetical protein QA640_23515 [Bradyrhizobium sp. CB82]|uniref:hypothetical protein n=1 Tax=Bradyrhizobium sp. CB82 TaxID=3039159 RepID=UPI0024B0DE2A|nr:hypothetical protein [Bradyrhizobium sp. CB82]WFU37451.1 hypothetical protein QA640_23515 [Bradyrhizobium sp. CB82]
MRVALILVGLSTVAVMEFETPPRATKPVNEPTALAAVGSFDTLTTADRLEIPHMLEAPPQPISSSEAMSPPDHPSMITEQPSKIIEQHKRSARGGKSAVVLPRVRPERGISKVAAKLNRSKPVAEVKPCPSGAFDGLLRALNLSTRCQT